MAKVPDFDVVAAHKHFSASCFNKAWDLIEKKNRTPEEDVGAPDTSCRTNRG